MVRQRITPQDYEGYIANITEIQHVIGILQQTLPVLPITREQTKRISGRCLKLLESLQHLQERITSEYQRPLTKTEIRDNLSRADGEQLTRISNILKSGDESI